MQFACNVKQYILEKNKINISKYCLLKVLPSMQRLVFITKTCLFKYTENFITKNENFQIKKISDIFHISAQNIDCGYSLELPQ